MGFIESNLLIGEKVIYQAKLHWCIFIRPVFFCLIALVLMLLRVEEVMHNFQLERIERILHVNFSFMTQFFSIILLLAIVYFVFVIINYNTTEIIVTNKRISWKKGIIARVAQDINLCHIESVIFTQKIVGRIFNYGHVYIFGDGSTKKKFPGIYDPLELRNIIIAKTNDGKIDNEISLNKDWNKW